MEEPEQAVRRLHPPAHSRPSEERGDAAAADNRTSPFPYAENFDEWVVDETAAPDGRQHRSVAIDADALPARA